MNATGAACAVKPLNQRAQQREERRRKFVDAAETLFLERGFAGASVNEVVRIAGGSLATLYAEFGTKEKLFEAVMSTRVNAAFAGAQAALLGSGSVADELRALVTRIQARTLSADGLAIYRLAVAEGPRFPALRKSVLNSGLKGFLLRLCAYFEQLGRAGRLSVDDPMLAAQRLLALAQSQQQFIAGCGDVRRYTPRLRVLHVEQAVAAFMCIYPPSGPATVSTAASHPDPAAIQRRASRANAGASQRKPVRKTVAGSVTAPQR